VARFDEQDDRHRSDRRSLQVVGLTTDGRLVRFDAATPGRTRSIGRLKGLTGDRSPVGIDYRVQDGKLYGVGNAGGIDTSAPPTPPRPRWPAPPSPTPP
jgi:hypothetical protein